MGGEAHAAQIGNDDRAIGRERRRDRRPHVSGVAESVQQHHRGPMSADPHMQRRPVGRNLGGVETVRKRRYRAGGSGDGESADDAGEESNNGRPSSVRRRPTAQLRHPAAGFASPGFTSATAGAFTTPVV